MRLAFAVLLTACVDQHDGTLPILHDCEPHTATIYEPADNEVVPTGFSPRVSWNEPMTPDRFVELVDRAGNFFIGTAPEEVLGDGSIRMHFQLPAHGDFKFTIGWVCDAGNDGPLVPLASVHVTTP